MKITQVKLESVFSLALSRTQRVHYTFAVEGLVVVGVQVDTAFLDSRQILFPFSSWEIHVHASLSLLVLWFLSGVSACLPSFC